MFRVVACYASSQPRSEMKFMHLCIKPGLDILPSAHYLPLTLAGQTTLFISALDSTIVATAIPTISSELKSAAGYAWMYVIFPLTLVTIASRNCLTIHPGTSGGAYILANTTAAPIWVKLSDIFGRKIIIFTAVSLHIAATILCALSVSMRMLIASRALQGVAGCGLIQ